MTKALNDIESADRKRIRNTLRRINRMRAAVSCPASRHVIRMGEVLGAGRAYPMIQEEPRHVALSLLWTVEALWKARTEIARLKKKAGET